MNCASLPLIITDMSAVVLHKPQNIRNDAYDGYLLLFPMAHSNAGQCGQPGAERANVLIFFSMNLLLTHPMVTS